MRRARTPSPNAAWLNGRKIGTMAAVRAQTFVTGPKGGGGGSIFVPFGSTLGEDARATGAPCEALSRAGAREIRASTSAQRPAPTRRARLERKIRGDGRWAGSPSRERLVSE